MTGTSSLLVWAVGGSPSKDTLWSSDNGNVSATMGGCDPAGCPPDHSSAGAVLHTMLALFSTGPIGFSDAPGWTNASLLARTCDAHGALLQPSRPITSVDSTFDATPGAAPQGYVLGTHSSLGGSAVAVAHYVLAHQLSADFALRALDLWPPLAPGAQYATASWDALEGCANASTAAGCGISLLTAPPSPAGQLLVLPRFPAGADAFAPSLTIVVPRCNASGAALFGDAAKFATMSAQRFEALSCTSGGLAVTLQGLPGEAVKLVAMYVTNTGEARTAVALAAFPVRATAHASSVSVSCVLEGPSFTCNGGASGGGLYR